MRFALSLSIALLYAGVAQAEDDLSQFQPSLYCDPVPEGRLIIEKDGRRETAGKQMTYNVDGEVFKLEERYIAIKGQKCAIKVFGELENYFYSDGEKITVGNEETNITLPVHGTFKDIFEEPYLGYNCYNVSFNELIDREADFQSCKKRNSDDRYVCEIAEFNKLNKRGFAGYFATPMNDSTKSCSGETTGFYYLDGQLGILDQSGSDYPALPGGMKIIVN